MTLASAGFGGVWPVLYAFWDDRDRLDEAAMRRQVDDVIARGAHGVTVLGLVTEVHKMDVNERLALVELVGDAIARRAPYAVTVAEPSLPGQVAFARSVAAAGADIVILQPQGRMGERDLVRFFGAVAEAVDTPVAVQNNPVNLESALSVAGLLTLQRNHPNITVLKGEGFSVDIAEVIAESGGAYRVFGGHGGLELMALLRSGGVGLIPAPDFLAPQVRIFELWRDGTPAARAEAERIHREILPAIVFMSRSVPALLTYGKRLYAGQAGIAIRHERAPALPPSPFGLSEVARFAAEIAAAARVAA